MWRPAQVERRPRPAPAVWERPRACDQRCRACGPHSGRARPDELRTGEALRLVDELAAFLSRVNQAPGWTVYDTSTIEEKHMVDLMPTIPLDVDDA